MSIERWDETTNSMQVRENGEFVRYTDHAAEIAALRERCGRLARAAKIEHLHIPDDPWYSCPASGQCTNDDAVGCNCGAEQHNAMIDAICNDLAPPAKEDSDG